MDTYHYFDSNNEDSESEQEDEDKNGDDTNRAKDSNTVNLQDLIIDGKPSIDPIKKKRTILKNSMKPLKPFVKDELSIDSPKNSAEPRYKKPI